MYSLLQNTLEFYLFNAVFSFCFTNSIFVICRSCSQKKKKSNKKKNNQQQKSPCSIFYFSLSPADGDGTRTPYVKVYYSSVVYLLPYHCKEKVTQSAIFSFFTSNYFRFFYLIYIQIYIYIYIKRKAILYLVVYQNLIMGWWLFCFYQLRSEQRNSCIHNLQPWIIS